MAVCRHVDEAQTTPPPLPLMRAAQRAKVELDQTRVSSMSVNSESSLGEVILYPQVLTGCDSSSINFHVNLLKMIAIWLLKPFLFL